MMLPGVGVFGTGSIVRILVPSLRSKGFKIEAIWGRTEDVAEEVAEDLDIPFFTTRVDEVLLRKDVDLVCIVCPPNLHAQIAVKALGIGKHVLCDRPAGLCQIEVLKMLNAAQYYPSLISIMSHGLRFLPAFVQMKKNIKESYIGEINVCEVRVHCGSLLESEYSWMCDSVMGGGVLNTIGSHIIDLITFLTNQKAVRVHGMFKTYVKNTSKIKGIRQITSDDFCTFQMELNKSACATVILNTHMPGQFMQEVVVCGTEGRLVAHGGNLYGQKNSMNKEEVILLDIDDAKQTQEKSYSNDAQLPKPYVKGLLKLVGALKEAFGATEDKHGWAKGPVSMAATFEDAHYIQAVIDAVRQSSKNREWVKVEIIMDEPDPNPLLSAAVRRSLTAK